MREAIMAGHAPLRWQDWQGKTVLVVGLARSGLAARTNLSDDRQAHGLRPVGLQGTTPCPCFPFRSKPWQSGAPFSCWFGVYSPAKAGREMEAKTGNPSN
jgi:hypothetical protein